MTAALAIGCFLLGLLCGAMIGAALTHVFLEWKVRGGAIAIAVLDRHDNIAAVAPNARQSRRELQREMPKYDQAHAHNAPHRMVLLAQLSEGAK